MDITIKRHYFCSNYVIGRCYVGDIFWCDTLESPTFGVNRPCIPAGDYLVNLVWSPKFNRYMPRLVNVPNRSGILICYGNSFRDALGCILVGLNAFEGHLSESLDAFDDIFHLMTNAVLCGDKVIVHVVDIRHRCYE